MDGCLLCCVMLFWLSQVEGLQLIGNATNHVINEGDNIMLSCSTKSSDFNMITSPLTIYKVKGTDKRPINLVGSISSPFEGTNRYSVALKGEKFNELQLTISGVTGAESGEYSCEAKGAENPLLNTITVVSPIDSVALSSTPELQGHQLVLQVGQPSIVTCDVKGGRPQPIVRMYQGDLDITDQFVTNTTLTQDSSEGQGLEITTFQTILTKKDYDPGRQANGEQLKCEAKVNLDKSQLDNLGTQGVVMEKAVQLEIKFAPEIECDREKESAVGQDSVELECVVHASPQIDMDKITWSFGPNDNKTVMNEGNAIDGFDTYASVDEDSGKVRVTIRINDVSTEDFQNYQLKVVNEIGEKTHQIDFFQKTSTEKASTKKGHGVVVDDVKSSSRSTHFTAASLLACFFYALVHTS